MVKSPVEIGAEVMDKLVPGWFNEINVNNLDMGSINLCVLGQVFGVDVERKVARAMHPELFDKFKRIKHGYGIGRAILSELESTGKIDELGISREEVSCLRSACSGAYSEHSWKEEIQKRKDRCAALKKELKDLEESD